MKRFGMVLCAAILLSACGEAERSELLDTTQIAEPTTIEADDDASDADDRAVEDEAVDPESVGPTIVLSSHGEDVEGAQAHLLDLINQERRDRGLGTLKTYWDLEDDGFAQSERMRDAGHIYHNPDLSSVAADGVWARLGENVGVGGSTDSLHQAFMDSRPHRANVLGDFTHVGIGVVYEDHRLWVTVVFMKAAIDGVEDTFGPFRDDDFDTHEANIHKIYEAGVTHGCGPQRYCPGAVVTRAQMAAFLTRALQLPPAAQDYFTDDDGAWYEADANAMAEAGVTRGCSDDEYCGSEGLTRAQMATFLDRAFDYPETGQDYFTDDDGAWYEQHANDLAAAGITHGCTDSTYSGEKPVTRAQMASFLARALGL